MRISLLFPPSIYQTKQTMPPLGLAWIAAVLRENGYRDVQIIDSVINSYSDEKIIEILQEQRPDIIGVSFGTQNRLQTFQLMKKIKSVFPETPLVAGGPHPTLTADDMMRHIKVVDVIVRGEGEYTFLDLVKTIESKGDLSSVKGISYRAKKEIIHNPPREPIADLDSLPFPARDLLPMDKYKQTIPLTDISCTSMLTARGCPYSCVYCSTAEQWGHRIRHRSADNIIAEIEELVNKYGFEGVGFFDDVFTMDKRRVIEFCQKLIDKKLDIKWWCEARANTIDKEMVSWMKKAGCEHISMAIESGSERILKNIKKVITLEQAENAVKVIKEAGIKLKIFFMHGLPGEEYADIKKTVFLSRYLQRKYKVDEATQGVTVIYPRTELERQAKEMGILPKNFSWSTHFREERSYPPLLSCEYVPLFEQPGLSYEKIFKYVKRAKFEYYIWHPIQLLKNLYRYRKTIKMWLATKVK
jgi:anaerobic magnesium-protoporphyrin IX monomethyl ester cyclase